MFRPARIPRESGFVAKINCSSDAPLLSRRIVGYISFIKMKYRKLASFLSFLAPIWLIAIQVWYYLQFSAPIRSLLASLRKEFLR